MGVLPAYVFLCITHMPGTQRRERASDKLELELQMAVNQDVGAGNRTPGLCKSRQ